MKRDVFKKTGVISLVLALLAAGAFFMANVPMPWWSHYVSAVNVVLFALPAVVALHRWLGFRDAVLLIAVLAAYALAIEYIALRSGYPYGEFAYSEHLGFKLFGIVPWTVAFAWTPLLLGAYMTANAFFHSTIVRVCAAVSLLVGFDIVIDPGAVRLGFWSYTSGGDFYGVPISNFGGWVASGLAGVALLEIALRRFRPLLPVPAQLAVSVILILFFWTGFAVFAGMLWPALAGVGLIAIVLYAFRRTYYAYDDIVVFANEKGGPIGTGPKAASHHADTRLHLAFSVFLFNSRGEVLMQQRAAAKKTWPGVWSNSCCGHVMLHETVIAAAHRRLRHELAIGNVTLSVILPDFRYRAELDGVVENEICPVLIGFTNQTPKPNPDEVEAVRWMDWNRFLRAAADPASGISPWAVEEVMLLAGSELFQKAFSENTLSSGSPIKLAGEPVK